MQPPTSSSSEQSKELQAALAFVIGRIETSATRSGEPLTDEQRFLLNNLPRTPVFSQPLPSDPESPPQPWARDVGYERLIALAKEARMRDAALNPYSKIEWRYVAAVLKLHRHPMCWLLQWAGVRQRRLWWDRPLLIGISLLFTFCAIALGIIGLSAPRPTLTWIIIGIGYVAMLLVLYCASLYTEKLQLNREIANHYASLANGPIDVQSGNLHK